MKKLVTILFVLLTLCLGVVNVYAAYLRNVSVTVTQPDGTVLHCFASGDEFFNYLRDGNGYTIYSASSDGLLCLCWNPWWQLGANRVRSKQARIEGAIARTSSLLLAFTCSVLSTATMWKCRKWWFVKLTNLLTKNSISLQGGVFLLELSYYLFNQLKFFLFL